MQRGFTGAAIDLVSVRNAQPNRFIHTDSRIAAYIVIGARRFQDAMESPTGRMLQPLQAALSGSGSDPASVEPADDDSLAGCGKTGFLGKMFPASSDFNKRSAL
jgi:hypothetical protein